MGKPLKRLKKKKGEWTFSYAYLLMLVRKAWGIYSDAEWDALPYRNRCKLIAEYETSAAISNYEAYLAEKRAAKDTAR